MEDNDTSVTIRTLSSTDNQTSKAWESPEEDNDIYPTIPNPYGHYSNLGSDQQEIRLLKIIDSDPSTGPVVKLFRTSLLDCPPYEALSYCWGELSDTATVTVVFSDHELATAETMTPLRIDGEGHPEHDKDGDITGVQFDVTANLHGALRSLPTNDGTFYWIDMLCINQGNVKERSEQVTFMRSIYTTAESVVVWLGDDLALKNALFAPENHMLAMFGLMMEEMGWSNTNQSLTSFFKRWEEKYDETTEMSERPRHAYIPEAASAASSSLSRFLIESHTTFGVLEPLTPFVKDRQETPSFELTRSMFEDWLSEPIFDELSVSLSGTTGANSINEILDRFRRGVMDPASEIWQLVESYLLDDGRRLSKYSHQITLASRMRPICRYPWFRRIWVLQEAASNHNVVLQVGATRGSWQLFVQPLKIWDKVLLDGYWHLAENDNPNLPTLWYELQYRNRTGTLGIDCLLDYSWGFFASDPRDMVIALVGLASDFRGAPRFRPDYAASVEETYTRFTAFVIRATGSLGILLKARIGLLDREPSDLPSWVPDFDAVYEVYSESRGTYDWGWGKSIIPVSQRLTEDPRKMLFGGLTLATVRSTIDVVADDFGPDEKFLSGWWRKLKEASSTLTGSPPQQTKCTEFAGHDKFTVRDFFSAFDPIPDGHDDHVDFWERSDSDFVTPGTSFMDQRELVRLRELRRTWLSKGGGPSRFQIWNSIRIHMDGQVFFLTQTGSLGLCPKGTRPGDLVVALYGLDVPVALRLVEPSATLSRAEAVIQGNQYQILGFCELTEFMGEEPLHMPCLGPDRLHHDPAEIAKGVDLDRRSFIRGAYRQHVFSII